MNQKAPLKKRADTLLVEKGLADSRTKAQALVMAGKVRIGSDHVVSKPSEMLPENTKLTVDSPQEFVSRGAYKLLPALDKYLPDLSGIIALDIGASTGGFTDLMLARGAAKVYCVDSGRGQLHDKLRRDYRVVALERTNARFLDNSAVPDKIDIMTMDVSFISATLLMPPCADLMKPDAWAFILVKPQFEAGRENVPRGGVVTDENVRKAAVDKVVDCAAELGWHHLDTIASPLKGPKGNQEYVTVFQAKNKQHAQL